MEVGFKRDDEFPFRSPPTVLAHPRAFRDIELTIVRSYLAADQRGKAFAIKINVGFNVR